MRFSDPAGDAIILDGTYLWLYTPSTTPGQVIRMALPSDPVYGPNVLARILDKPAERYETTLLRADSVDGRPVDVVEFIPNGGDPLFRRAVIWLDRENYLPRRLELDELTGVRRTLTLSKIRTNTAISRREFAFDVPAGVRVVDR
jgi:outer membrane lipoprotein carrier protein